MTTALEILRQPLNLQQFLRTGKGQNALVFFAILVGLGLRLLLAYTEAGNYDQQSFAMVARIQEQGGNVYAETSRYNYSPVWAHILLFLNKFATWRHIQLRFMVRSSLIVVDLLVAFLIGLLCKQAGTHSARTGFSVYLLNPVAILLAGSHGQFENLTMLPILLATYIYSNRNKVPGYQWYVWLLGTGSLLIKHVTLFGVWTLFQYMTGTFRATLFFLTSMLIFLSSFIPYLSEGADGIRKNVLFYHGQTPVAVLPFLLSLLALLPFVSRKYFSFDHVRAMGLWSVALLVLMVKPFDQHFIIPIFFGTIFSSKWYWIYTIAATFSLAGSIHNICILPFQVPWEVVWIPAAGWMISCLVRPTRGRESFVSNSSLP